MSTDEFHTLQLIALNCAAPAEQRKMTHSTPTNPIRRAGRDGRQALAVLFVDGADNKILEFMARKTIEHARLPPDEAKRSLDVRCQEIRTMQDLAKARACVRQGIRRYFGANRRSKRRTMGWRILSWVFEARDRGTKRRFCCDQCERVGRGTELAFAQRVLLHRRDA